MKLSEFKNQLNNMTELAILNIDGQLIPPHIHVTEAGLVTKNFIDCGGTVRSEKRISLQAWVSVDTDHRLAPEKLSRILEIAEPLFENEDPDVEIEYQMDTIGRFGVDVVDGKIRLLPTKTDCLALDSCGLPADVTANTKSLNVMAAGCCPPGQC